MSEPKVTVLPLGQRVRAWPRHDQGAQCYVTSLSQALERAYRSDAHMAAYVSPVGRRLDHGALEKLELVELGVVVFDVDMPGHVTPTPEWRCETREKVVALDNAYPGLFYYETRGGFRIVYRQHATEVLHDREDAERWSRSYLVACAHLRRRFGIDVDTSCHDWTRLFRLPHATRDESGKPENWPTWGDPKHVGPLLIKVDDLDIAAAQERATRRFQPRRARTTEPTGMGMFGRGLLFHVLDARGEIEHREQRGGHVCLCPNRAQHGKNTDWTDSTMYFAPDAERRINEVGVIDCKHQHCEHLGVKDWVRFFDPAELEAARVSAGIKRPA